MASTNIFFLFSMAQKPFSLTVSKTISSGQKLIRNLSKNIHISESLLAI
jgi:hypothetical protein